MSFIYYLSLTAAIAMGIVVGGWVLYKLCVHERRKHMVATIATIALSVCEAGVSVLSPICDEHPEFKYWVRFFAETGVELNAEMKKKGIKTL